jgi:hypothetical protein
MHSINVKLDLCEELVKTLRQYEFTNEEIGKVTANPLFIDSINKEDKIQKAMLSLMLYRIAVYSNTDVSKNIKLALNATVSSLHWLDNVKLSVIPFIKNNNLLATHHG